MNYKLLILIALIASVLLSGCIDDRNFQAGVKYPIIKATFDDNGIKGDTTIYYIDNQTINTVPVHIVKEQNEDVWGYYTRGKIIIDNESYLKIISIERAEKYSPASLDTFYSEIHLTMRDYIKYSVE